jgi:isopentenyldiphosphate isomerase
MTTPAALELVDVVDADDRVLRQATRAEMRRENLLHRAVYLLVFNGRGEILVHRRTTAKDVYPGFWDVTVGGVVDAGETYETAARRELAEEVGIAGVTIATLFDVRYADATTQLIGRAFLVRHDGPIRLQPEEVAWATFVPLGEADRIMREERCCPDGAQVLRRYLGATSATSS